MRNSVLNILILIFGVFPPTLIATSIASEEPPPPSPPKTNAPVPVDLASDNYDPYDAQAPAVKLHAAMASNNPYAPLPQNTYAHAHYHYQPNPPYPQPAASNQYNNHNNYGNPNARLDNNNNYDEDKLRYNNLYDPFYFFGRQRAPLPSAGSHGVGFASAAPSGAGVVGSVRNRRNSRLYVNRNRNTKRSNDLLNEDVYFFRRKDTPTTTTGDKEKLRVFEDSPYYYRDSRPQEYPRRYPQSDSFKFFMNQRQPVAAPPSSRPYPNAFEGRGYSYPPPQSNQIDYYERERARYADRDRQFEREPLQRGTIDGWSVQVGTQLQVHDDGRSRDPSRHYIKDERPGSVRGYPYHRDRQ